jgi:hypothetical protein
MWDVRRYSRAELWLDGTVTRYRDIVNLKQIRGEKVINKADKMEHRAAVLGSKDGVPLDTIVNTETPIANIMMARLT